MWYRAENGDSIRPAAIDQTSSRIYVYVRKNITFVEESGEGEFFRPAHYEWLEAKILKTNWDIYEKVIGHDDALDDVYSALIELAEMIAG